MSQGISRSIMSLLPAAIYVFLAILCLILVPKSSAIYKVTSPDPINRKTQSQIAKFVFVKRIRHIIHTEYIFYIHAPQYIYILL